MKRLVALFVLITASLAFAMPREGCAPGNFPQTHYETGEEGWCCVTVGNGSAYSCTNGTTWELWE